MCAQSKLEKAIEWQNKLANRLPAGLQPPESVSAVADAVPVSYEAPVEVAASASPVAAVNQGPTREQLKNSAFVKSASDALNSRFSDMFKAFQYVDLDRSGTLNEKEIRRALDMWNIPISDEKLRELILACDFDGDGAVDYKEFVDVLARDTVAPAAMGKRDMQSLEAMGVDSQEMLAHQLGHKSKKQHESISINASAPKAAVPQVAAPAASRAPTASKPTATREQLKNSAFVKSASDALNSRFSDMFKAFQYVDLDRSGTLNEKEIRRALDMWNIPISDEKLRELILACDFDGDGAVDYKEFVDVLARDTVAPAAMGKRDMQSLEAMGVDSQEMLAHQLGHKSKKQHESISINS